MIIGIDIRVLQEGRGGTYVYARELLRCLLPLAKNHQIKLFANQLTDRPILELKEFLQYPNVKLYKYRFPNKFLNAAFLFKNWPKIDKLLDGCDVLFFPTMLYARWSAETKAVLTMHDVSFLKFPEFFSLKQNLWHKLVRPRELCQTAAAVIAVSESTKRDIIEEFGLPASRVRAVHSGITDIFRPLNDKKRLAQVRAKYNLPSGRYIIQAGTLEPRKNGLLTVAAFGEWKTKRPAEAKDFRLLFCGHRGWKTGKLRRAIRRSPWRRQIQMVEEVEKNDMPALYNLAEIAAYPSFYEGFGLPILEAFACGVPVVTAANSSLGEVAGAAALLIDPYRVDDLVAVFSALSQDKELARRLRAKGLARTVEFSWEKTARETLKVLESVASH